jgi:hypothetical protein
MGMLPRYSEVKYLTSSERSCIPPTGSIGSAGDVALQICPSFRTTIDSTMARGRTGHVSWSSIVVRAIADLQYRS